MQTTKLWLYNYLLPVAASVLLILQALSNDLAISTQVIQAAGILLLLAVFLRLSLLLKNEWQRHHYEKQHQELVTIHYWRQKTALPVSITSQQRWNGLRIFRVADKVRETEDIYSFYLKPHDGKPLPAFYAGQFLNIQIKHPQQNKTLNRCYSLSDSPSADYYRISVKKEEHGLVSSYLHQQLQVGDVIEAKAPSGAFYLDMETSHPVVLIANGVGITPLLAMLNTLIARQDPREVHLFYGVRNDSQVMMKAYLQELVENNLQFHLHLCYSQPNPEDDDYHYQGRVTIELLRLVLPASNYHYYLCGSLAMMEGLSADLKNWGVPKNDIHFESFGTEKTAKKVIEESSEAHTVFFRKSNKKLSWSAKEGSLLDFAENNDIPMESACRSGQCGMCATKINQGEIEYLSEASAEVEKGQCLSCISVPKQELVLEL